MKITVLGCGSSAGVPHLKFGWGECDPNNSKNNRTRSSVLVQENCVNVLIDASPDLRQQMLRLGDSMPDIHAILFSHEHYDHSVGMCELRPVFYGRKPLCPVYAEEKILTILQSLYPYLFQNDTNEEIYKPIVNGFKLEPEFVIKNEKGQKLVGTSFEISHGVSNCSGFRFGNFAYTTDLFSIPEKSFEKLYGLDVWIVDAISRNQRPAHAGMYKVLELVEKLTPKMTYLTHMGFEMDYDSLLRELPPHVRPSYDGLVIEI